MSNLEQGPQRKRLNAGDIVYFVEGRGILGRTDEPLAIKKGTLEATTPPRRCPIVAIWDDVRQRPTGAWTVTGKSPQELFTPDEVRETMQQSELRDEASRPVDDLVADAATNRELAALLGGKVIERTADAFLSNPQKFK